MRIIFGLLLVLCWSTAASSQALQPGDTISISVYQDPKLDRQVLIGPSGMISFPLAGQIRAGGMTPEALETVLKSKLKDKFTEEPDITVSFVTPAVPPPPRQVEEDLRRTRIFITGEVLRPGFFMVRTRLTVMQAVAMAGGFGPYAAKRRIPKFEGRSMERRSCSFSTTLRFILVGMSRTTSISCRGTS